MAKLYPPLIEGSIPAFCAENGIVKITIPFSMNRAVGKGQVSGLAVKVKTVQSSTYLYTATIISPLYYNLDIDIPYVTVIVSGNTDEERKFINKLRQGQFYKFQIAYIDLNGEVGYYSTVGVAKYTTEPSKLEIAGMKDNINLVQYEYTGVYSQEGRDTTERVYSYQFDVYDKNNNLFMTSGEQLHNSQRDTDTYESHDTFILNKELVYNERYFIQYTVTTINGMTMATRRYSIMNRSDLIEPEIHATVEVSVNKEEGYIDVNLVGRLGSIATGAFLLTRKVEDNEESIWNKLSTFRLKEESPTRHLFRDFTIEHGKTYQYAIQQFSDSGLYSSKIKSELVTIDFEYSYLYDGEVQLKIKYNPKISSFKTDVLETKTDTIGGKYPFIFRNGSVYYREFPISGLLSHLMDDEGLFMNKEKELYLEEDLLTKKGRLETSDQTFKYEYSAYKEREKLTNLNENNIIMERRFKLKAMEWLTNGKPKLFRSPTEGNFIIRVMNTSMTPNDTLGRMLHTFNSTAYEIAEFNFDNLVKFGFITIEEKDNEKILQWETIKFAEEELVGNEYNFKHFIYPGDDTSNPIMDIDHLIELPAGTVGAEQEWRNKWSNTEGRWLNQPEDIKTTDNDKLRGIKYRTYKIGKVNNQPITRVEFYDMEPGSQVKLGLADGSIVEVVIGMTGRYIVDIEVPIYEVVLEKNTVGKMVYSYYAEQPNTFKTIANITYTDIIAEQCIGESTPIYDLLKVPQTDGALPSYNPKNEITEYYYVRAYHRPIQDIYFEIVDGIKKFYLDENKRAELLNPDAFVLYRVNPFIEGSTNSYYYDFYNDKEYPLDEYNPILSIQSSKADNTGTNNFINQSYNQMISLEKQFSFETKLMNDFIGYLSCGNGVVLEFGYSMKITDYVVEQRPGKYPTLATAKSTYEEAVSAYNEYISQSEKTYTEEAALRTEMKNTYQNYMRELISALAAEEEEETIYG